MNCVTISAGWFYHPEHEQQITGNTDHVIIAMQSEKRKLAQLTGDELGPDSKNQGFLRPWPLLHLLAKNSTHNTTLNF
ncbi:hypothetical protein [Pseudomonas sp. MWU13-2105]|uniref:hypothetical protein n=1 Tax=Pseudomonas sp. MWU13-2105 TaxID=2935074 RepID=UPI00200BD0D0|nr:hypothetical protein [Pseudomonas sp. MWU13-2105]